MKTVFITGASSGIGHETAKLFSNNGWNVIATMRKPEIEIELNKKKNIRILRCDVTETESIKQSIKEGIDYFGKIDVLINNAGFYTIGALEAATEEQIRKQLDTNLFGLINTTKEMLPYFRKQKSGIIINISSIAGRTTVPLQTLYHATKWGVEGFSESLQYELSPFNIKIKIIEPGVIKTDFYGRSMTVMENNDLDEYRAYSQKVVSNLVTNGNNGSNPLEVAETIFKAANSKSNKMRYPVGKSKNLIALSNILPDKIFHNLVRAEMQK
ncbi:SDR family oxidoreductase [Clostridium beijerinckii]|uniref:SDR family oxidoreductase n=1 Tax=Clostridium beijerinckii TaxID=1520 RepID=UPI00080A545C|nr:SDR family oxidoreductase [Clostridium beijerinckii]OCA96678.1 short-chain dehydrogenase/reductase [Clostridium beijerinckii]